MNYLAHLYLSGESEDLRFGNFIADSIRGKELARYQDGVLQGIMMHRAIDLYTDKHTTVNKSVARLKPGFKRYAPVIIDVFYDHFLAKNWSIFHNQTLEDYTKKIYLELETKTMLMPTKAQSMFPFMKQQNWLLAYASLEGIDRALGGMARRASFESNMEKATAELEKNYTLYENEFFTFIEDLKLHIQPFLLG